MLSHNPSKLQIKGQSPINNQSKIFYRLHTNVLVLVITLKNIPLINLIDTRTFHQR